MPEHSDNTATNNLPQGRAFLGRVMPPNRSPEVYHGTDAYGPFVSVELSGRHGVGNVMKLDPEEYAWVQFLTRWWVVVCGASSVQVTTGKKLEVFTGPHSAQAQRTGLARLIMKVTSSRESVWAINGNAFDLRKRNLEVISQRELFARNMAARGRAA